MIIAPSILSADFANLESEIKSVSAAEWIHVDVMDGHFVPNITIGAPVVKSLRKVTDKVLDVHLMIENPEKYLEDFINAGSDIITFHYEAAKEKSGELIDFLHSKNVKAGISIKPKTKVSEIEKYLDKVDLALVMTVEPGFGGQSFMMDCAEKIAQIKKINPKVITEVDGGINESTAKICEKYGIDVLVAGSYIFNSTDRTGAIRSLNYPK